MVNGTAKLKTKAHRISELSFHGENNKNEKQVGQITFPNKNSFIKFANRGR